MFKNIKFSIIDYGVELAPKRSKIINNLITKNEVTSDNLPDYIITNKTIKLSHIKEIKVFKDNPELLNKVQDRIYSTDLITNWIRLKEKVAEDVYKIRLGCNSDTGYRSFNKNKLYDSSLDDIFNKREMNFNRKEIVEEFLNEQDKSDIINEIEVNTLNLPNNSDNNLLNNCINTNNIYSLSEIETISTKGKIKGINPRLNEIINLSSNFNTNNISNNKELFQSIQNQIKTELKEDNIYSDEELTVKDETQSIMSTFDSTFESTFESSKSFPNSKTNPNKFAFSQGTNHQNLNQHITSELEKVLEFHNNESNVFESLAYRKAIATLKNSQEKITDCDQLKKYKNLGKSIGNKVREIILTGRLIKGEIVSNDERNKTLKILMGVWGVGKKLAEKLFRKGIKSIEDLRSNQNMLNQNQKIGLKYYEDIQKRIPREEIEEIFKVIKENLYKILPEDIIEIELCGSYRRGKSTCGDIDVLITRKDDGLIDGILQSLVNSLMILNLVTDILTLALGSTDKSNFMGVCKHLNFPYRRIDIKVYRKEYYPFALLYFTGSAYFNRSMRLFATKIGYQLCDYYLKNLYDGSFVECKSEQEIFVILGIDYKLPNERDI